MPNHISKRKFATFLEEYQFYLSESLQNNAEAQYELGYCYFYGIGVKENRQEAIKWHQRAAENGYAKAQSLLAGRYHVGKYIEQDDAKAFYWYCKSAELGDVEGQYQLALFYEQGIEVAQNYQLAKEWYLKAATQEHQEACYRLGMMYKQGLGMPINEKEAWLWFINANSHRPAAFELQQLRNKYALKIIEDKPFDLEGYKKSEAKVFGLWESGEVREFEYYENLLSKYGIEKIAQLLMSSGLSPLGASLEDVKALVSSSGSLIECYFTNTFTWSKGTDECAWAGGLFSEIMINLLPELSIEWLEEEIGRPYIWLRTFVDMCDFEQNSGFNSYFFRVNDSYFAFLIDEHDYDAYIRSNVVYILNKLLAYLNEDRRCYFARNNVCGYQSKVFLAKEKEFEEANKWLKIAVYKPNQVYKYLK